MSLYKSEVLLSDFRASLGDKFVALLIQLIELFEFNNDVLSLIIKCEGSSEKTPSRINF
jgi:hypothetical protein